MCLVCSLASVLVLVALPKFASRSIRIFSQELSIKLLVPYRSRAHHKAVWYITSISMPSNCVVVSALCNNKHHNMSLDTLPAEILFEVFSSLSGFADATNLCRVSWNIRSFKLCNEASIFLALAPRCMASYQDASELIAAQNEHNPIDASQYTEDLGRSDLLYSKFKANALAVSKAADLYEGYLRPFLPMPKPKGIAISV